MSVTKNSYSKLIDVLSDVFGSFPSGGSLMSSISRKEIKELEQEKSFVACTLGGALSVHVKNGRVIKIESLTIPDDVLILMILIFLFRVLHFNFKFLIIGFKF